MEITTKKYSLPRLWVESFIVVNKCTGKLITAALCMWLLFGVIMVVFAMTMGPGALAQKLQMLALARVSGNTSALLPLLFFSFLFNLVGMFFVTVIWQIVSSQALGYKQPLTEAFSSSVLPTVYQLVIGVLLILPSLFISLALAVAAKLSPVLGLMGILAVGLVAIRFCYSFIAIAVDNKGPIEGLVQSWKLTSGTNYLDALLLGIMLIGSALLLNFFYMAVMYALRVIIPLYFANSFNLAHPSLIWWLLGLVLMVLGIFYYVAILTFPVLVFLNRNNQEQSPQPQPSNNTVFIPLPELDIPVETQPSQEKYETSSSDPALQTLPSLPTQEGTTAPAPVQENDKQQQQTLEELGIEKTSVNTTDEDTNGITQHLNQVYTPRSEEILQHADEDRMPTILFDDELAKQLQQGHELFTNNSKPADTDEPEEGENSVRLSK